MVEGMATLYARLEAYMAKKGLRSTAQRRVIADAFFSGPHHITIEELLARVRERDPHVGYATVYRTLKLFTEAGLAQERDFGGGRTRYELSDESADHHHDHLICLVCSAVIEFHDDKIESLQAKVARRFGFHVERHKHEIYGTCSACLAADARLAKTR